MPAYQYEALSDDGATQRGVIEADTAKAARGLLRQRGLVPLAVDTVSAGQREGETSLLNRRIGGRRPLCHAV
jgi:general secretion pathway protein F